MRSKCDSIQCLLSDYIDGILPDAQVRKIDQHLAFCSKCRISLNSLEKTNRLLDLYIEPQPPNGYFDQVWMQLKDEVSIRSKDGYLKSIKDSFGIKFRMLKNRLYDEFVWWADRVKWSRLLWRGVMVIVLIFCAIIVDRTHFRRSIDQAFLQKVTQSISKDGFYLIKYTPKPVRKARNAEATSSVALPSTYLYDDVGDIKATLNFTKKDIPQGHVFTNFVPSVVEFENGFLTFIGNIESIDVFSDRSGVSPQKDEISVKMNFDVRKTQKDNVNRPTINIASIQDIHQSFIRRKERINENPFRVFLTDFHIPKDELRVDFDGS